MKKEPETYENFRTNLTYYDVYHIIFARKWKRRKGVLGAWREIKKKMYKEYLEQFHYYEEKKEKENE